MKKIQKIEKFQKLLKNQVFPQETAILRNLKIFFSNKPNELLTNVPEKKQFIKT